MAKLRVDAAAAAGGNNGAVGQINSRGEISGWAEKATVDPDCAPPQKLDFEAVVWGPKPDDLGLLRRSPENTRLHVAVDQ